MDPCAAIQVPFELADGAAREIVFRLGVGPRRRRAPAAWCSACASPAPRARRSRRCGSTGRPRWAPCRSRRPTRRSTCWATAGWSTRRWPAACGGAAATTSRAAPSDSAISCRTSMALVHAEPRLLREHLLLCASRQFLRRRRAALVASALRPRRAHALLGRLPVAAAGGLPLRAVHRRQRGPGGAGAVPRRPRGERRGGLVLRPAAALAGNREPVPALRARHRARACASAPTACR